MTEISNIQEANKLLAQYVPLTRAITGKDITVARMLPLLNRVGNPHKRLRVIHVAGTSGKTSTAYFAASLLGQTDQKVGLTVSPHVDSITERIQINGMPLSDEQFCRYLGEFLELIKESQPTYFELLIAFALWVFDKEKVDYAVVEVGMGGLHDATNVLAGADKVCVITDIGLDHTNVLGNTLPEIAAQKAGIIHEHNTVFCIQQSTEIMSAIMKRAEEKHAQMCILTLDGEDLPEELPLFQRRNWFLARQAVQYVVERDGLHPLSEKQLRISLQTYVPARMEVVTFQGKTVVMDGAHNPQKMQALVSSLQTKFPAQKFTVLIGMLSGKDLEATLKVLQPIASSITGTEFKSEQDMPRGSIESKEITRAAKRLSLGQVATINDPQDAFHELVRSSSEPILVTGSFFLLNYIRPLMVKA